MLEDIAIEGEYEVISEYNFTNGVQRMFVTRYPLMNRLHFLTLFHLKKIVHDFLVSNHRRGCANFSV